MLLYLVSLFLFSACMNSERKVDTSDTCSNEKEKIEESKGKIEKDKTTWRYSEVEDEMSDKPIYFAYIESLNKEDFEFPYEGGSKLIFVIRESPEYGHDMYIKISKGQFNTNFDGEKIQMRFDDEEAFTVKCLESNDMSGDQLYLRSSDFDKILKLILNSKTMKIKADFFGEGSKTFKFNIEGLEWKH